MTSNIYNLVADQTVNPNRGRGGHKKYRCINIAEVAIWVASNSNTFAADVVSDINELIATDVKFADTLRKEIAKRKADAEFEAACAAHPELKRKLFQFVDGRRNWKKIAKRLGYNV